MTSENRAFLQVLMDVPEPLADITTTVIQTCGARGVEVRDSSTMTPPGSRGVPEGRCHILAWLDPSTEREVLEGELLAKLEQASLIMELELDRRLEVSFATIDAEDWVRKVRDSIQPVRVGRRILVRPSWKPRAPEAEQEIVEIVLDPGLAFGTGHHATTVLCMEALERLLDESQLQGTIPRVLDVGTGSGILAIEAALLGAGYALGIDNDPMAVRVARENASDNGVSEKVTITQEPPDRIDDCFDIVVANIHLGPLTELAPAIVARVAPNGWLLLSGLLEEQAALAARCYRDLGMKPHECLDRDGWALVSLRRPLDGLPTD